MSVLRSWDRGGGAERDENRVHEFDVKDRSGVPTGLRQRPFILSFFISPRRPDWEDSSSWGVVRGGGEVGV